MSLWFSVYLEVIIFNQGVKMKTTITMLLISSVLTGCVNLPEVTQIRTTSLKYNEALGVLKNQVILLNIARASERQPMLFTRVAKITDQSTIGGGFELSESRPGNTKTFTDNFGANGFFGSSVVLNTATNALSPKINGNLLIKPLVDQDIQDTKEFYNSFHTSLTPEDFTFFLSRGWPAELLAALMFESIETTTADGKTTTYSNNPDDTRSMTAFRDFLKNTDFLMEETTIDAQKFAYSLKDSKHLERLLKKGNFKPLKGSSDKVSYVIPKSTTDILTITGKTVQGKKIKGFDFEERFYAQTQQIQQTNNPPTSKTDSMSNVKVQYRSTQGIIYYLGECARDNNRENCYFNVTNQKTVERKQYYGQIKKGLLVNKFGHAITVSFGNDQFYISPASDDDITLTSTEQDRATQNREVLRV